MNSHGIKEETFIQTSRRGGDGQLGQRGHGKVAAGKTDGPTLVCRLTGRKNWGARQTVQPRVPVQGNKASKPLTEKPVGVTAVGVMPSLSGESLKRPTGS